MSDLSRAELLELLHDALHADGGESIEGGFVDRWESYAGRAREALTRAFLTGGMSAEEQAEVRAAVRDPTSPRAAVITLLTELRAPAAPLVEELLDEIDPRLRRLGVEAAAQRGAVDRSPERLAEFMKDADRGVRAAAVEAIGWRFGKTPQVREGLVQALDDPDPEIRTLAERLAASGSSAAAREALVARLYDGGFRAGSAAALIALAQKAREEGLHRRGEALEELLGPSVRPTLIRTLDHPDPAVRVESARALDRFYIPEVAAAMLARLQVEENLEVKGALLLFNGYEEEARPVLERILANAPEATLRYRAASLLVRFGPDAEAPLFRALADENLGVRRAAAMSLQAMGSLQTLGALTRLLADPANATITRELENAVRDIVINSRIHASEAAIESARAFARLEIEKLPVSELGQWPSRVCKEHGALPVHSAFPYVWAIRAADGEALYLDLDEFGGKLHPETDAAARFGAYVQAAAAYDELAPLIPAPVKGVRLCWRCVGVGRRQEDAAKDQNCHACAGIGWVPPQEAAAP